MATRKEAIDALANRLGVLKPKTPLRVAYLGDGRGSATSNLNVPGQPNYVYARHSLNQGEKHFAIFSRFIAPAINKPVVIGTLDWEPEKEQVIDFHMAGFEHMESSSAIGGLGAHHIQHEWGGGDTVWVDPRMMTIGLVTPNSPQDMTVLIKSFAYYYKTWERFGGETSIDFTQWVPTTDNIYVLIALDPTSKRIVYRVGNPFSGTPSLPEAGGWGHVPAPAGDEYPLAAIGLVSTTTLLDYGNINVARMWINHPTRYLHDKIDFIEKSTGHSYSMTTTGAAESPQNFKANAALLQGREIHDIDASDGQALVWDIDKNMWAPGTVSGAGETNLAANIGTGIESFREKSDVTFNFRTLVPGDGVNLSSATSTITIEASAGGGETNLTANIGTGFPMFREKSGVTFNLRTIAAGAGINISSATSLITIDASAAGTGETNTAANLGTGIEVFREKSASTLNLRTLAPGAGVNISSATSTITIEASAGGGETNLAANLGTGIETFREKSGVTFNFRTLIPGTNISISSATSAITISAVVNGAASVAFAPVGASLYATLASEINNGTQVYMRDWQSAYDTHSFFGSSTLDRFTIPTGQDGIYLISGGVTFSTNALGRRLTDLIKLNGEERIVGRSSVSSNDTGTANTFVSRILDLIAGDEIALRVQQNSGIGLSLAHHASGTPFFSIQKIAEHPNSSALIAQGAVGASLFNNSTSEINNASPITMTNWKVNYDTHGFFDAASLQDRFTIPAGEEGIYAVNAAMAFSTNGTGRRQIEIRKNDVGVIRTSNEAQGDGSHSIQAVAIVNVEAGDELSTKVRQDSGIGLSLLHNTGGSWFPSFTIQKLAELPGLAPTRVLNGDNLGTGIEVYREKSGGSLQFRTLAAGENITISSAASIVTIDHADHGARVYQTNTSGVDQEINDNTWTNASMTEERYDTDDFHSTTASVSSRFTIPTGLAGKYAIGGAVSINADALGERFVRIFKGGASVIATDRKLPTGSVDYVSVNTIYQLEEADFIELQAYQSSGGGLSLVRSGDDWNRIEFWIQKLA